MHVDSCPAVSIAAGKRRSHHSMNPAHGMAKRPRLVSVRQSLDAIQAKLNKRVDYWRPSVQKELQVQLGIVNRERPQVPVRTQFLRCGASMTFATNLRRVAILQEPLLQGIGAGKTWREAIAPLDIPADTLRGQACFEVEKWLAATVGPRVFQRVGNVRQTAEALDLGRAGRMALEEAVIAEFAMRELRTSSPDELAARWELSEQARGDLARLHQDMHASTAGHPART